MLYANNQNITDPKINLSLEEHLLRNVQVDEPILLFYINEPSVIIGRNQNTVEEIDFDYVKANGIHVVRRLSGGGAVYHDLGNLNFSFITPGKEDLHNFAKFTNPVIEVLASLGVTAELKGKSDIFASGKKISGNAQYAISGRMFSHGTLLFDTNIEQMVKALNPTQAKIESKAVQSIRKFVTNVRELLTEDMDIHQFKQAILEGLFQGGKIPMYDLSPTDWNIIKQISAERYNTWSWNYGRSPEFNLQKSQRTSVGKIDLRIDVDQGIIQGVKIYGDYSGRRDVGELETRLTGLRFDQEAIEEALHDHDIFDYFGPISLADFVKLFF